MAKDRSDRYDSAQALARALEDVTLRVDGTEDLTPYPGLATFTEKDKEYFFGREAEVEAVGKKLRELHLLGLIGPSGAGKSSFLRAGLIPTLPDDWRYILCKPGSSPFVALGQSLAPELSGDTEAVRQMIRFEDPDVALALISRWRERHSEVVVIVDQFEELFTQNPPEVQSRFAELLGRMAMEADARVLLSMRDDFLFHCYEHPTLSPIYSELTPLGPPAGAALRRALVQPALKCGYRFEDDALVEAMLREVTEERGALPLLAFAAARLWEKRDRDSGLLTRKAYREIGGVGGALAQHAEATLARIGIERLPIVREILRNLITAHGTRAARNRDELLSVFEDQGAADDVLQALIDARLLTSFEIATGEEGESHHQVEIIHESLLSAWPRLVRWQTQDADGAQLRDQLRQAAELWESRDRSEDLLWSGTSFKEFQVWREQYPGGLTSTEDAFATAMTTRAERQRKRRRVAVTGAFTVLIAVVGTIGVLWQRAVSEVERREAAQLLSLGRLELEDYPTAALAYALASLERADSLEARRFAVEALWQGPTAFVLPEIINSVKFSPDGRWLATGGIIAGVRLYSQEGGPPRTVADSDGTSANVGFGPGSDLLVALGKSIRSWSLPEVKENRQPEFEFEGDTWSWFLMRSSELATVTRASDTEEIVRAWPLTGGEPRLIARWDPREISEVSDWELDATGEEIAYARGDGVYLTRPRDMERLGGRLIGKHGGKVVSVAFHPAGDRILAADEAGEIRFWSLSTTSRTPERTLRTKPSDERMSLQLDQGGSRLVAGGPVGSTGEVAYVWDLTGPPDADPRVLRNRVAIGLNTLTVHPQGLWLATGNNDFALVWPLKQKYAHVLPGHSKAWVDVAFTPDGNSLVSSSDDGTLQLWPLSAAGGARSRMLIEDETARLGAHLGIDPTGRYAMTTSRFDGRVFLTPLAGDESRLMARNTTAVGSSHTGPLAFSPDGRRAAVAVWPPGLIRILDLHLEEIRTLDMGDEDCGLGEYWKGAVTDLAFTPDGLLISAGANGLRLWNPKDGTSKRIRPCSTEEPYPYVAVNGDGRHVLVASANNETQHGILSLVDLEDATSQEIASHGNRVNAVAMDPTGTIAVTGDLDGVVRVGPITGEEPHLLLGHRLVISSVAASPDGRWIASASEDGTIRLWPMPDMDQPPFHTLPYQELLDRIRSLTNVRVVEHEGASTGYQLDYAPFPGWKTMPKW